MRSLRSRFSLAAALVASSPAWSLAQSFPGFYPQRYVTCHEDEPGRAPPPPKPAADGAVPLLRKPAPRALPIAPLVVIDVALVQPVPARDVPPVRAPEPPPFLVAGDNDFHCIGWTRGKAGVLRVLEAAPGARFPHHGDGRYWRNDNARAAAAAGWREAIPHLHRVLDRPLPAGSGMPLFEALDAKLHAARALGDLGDATVGKKFAAHLAAREDFSWSLLWIAGVRALPFIDPVEAQAYAARFAERVASGKRRPTDPDAASDHQMLDELLPHMVKPSPEHLAVVKRLSGPQCPTLAARLRLGDDALRKELRPELATDLRTQRGVACYSTVMPALFPGEEPDEVDTLLFRWRYDELLHLLGVAKAKKEAGPLDAKWTAALAKVKTELQKRAKDPRIAGDKTDVRFLPETRAQHLAALAWLGDASAQAALDKLIGDGAERRVAPWVAAEAALALDLPKAADRAAERLRLAIHGWTERYSTKLDPIRAFVHLNEHVRVVDALAARKDPRFVLGLLDQDRYAREAAFVRLARHRGKPGELCDLVLDEAPGATDEAIDDALWALSLLGDACRARAWSLWSDKGRPKRARGMALELLAMMREPRIAAELPKREGRDELAAARRRARIIFHAKE